jgi:hypothetical protein
MTNETGYPALSDVGVLCPAAPECIWLQVDPEPEEAGKPEYTTDDVTWCVDKINDSDTLYIRADRTQRAIADESLLRQALDALESCGEQDITDGGRQWFDEKKVNSAHEEISARLAQSKGDANG